jgi:tetratricopeptide (TPR) repeat protein
MVTHETNAVRRRTKVPPVVDDRIIILFRKATELATKGRLVEAADAFRTALTLDPGLPEAHFNLGNVLLLQGLHRVAIDAFRKAVELRADYIPAYTNLGLALQEYGHIHEAIAAFQTVVRSAAQRAEAHMNLGNALHTAGLFAAACDAHRQAIECDPALPEAQFNLGNALLARNLVDEAAAAFRAATQMRAHFAQAHYKLGETLKAQGNLPAALDQFRLAASPGPVCPDALIAQGNILLAMHQPREAAEAYQASLAIVAGDPQALTNLGAALHQLGDFTAAIDCYRQAIGRASGHAPAWNNLGNALLVQGEFRGAAEAFREAIRLTPVYPEAYSNLGAALRDLRRPREALLACETALLQRPDMPDAHHNRGLVLLTLGRLEEAWPEHEWRLRTNTLRPRGFAQPQWLGQDIKGKRILLHAEQGLGDTLQFSRYAPLMAQKVGPAGQVILEVQPPLRRLFSTMPGIRVITQGDALPDFDLHCPLLSLPLGFATSLASIPRWPSYLTAPPPTGAQLLADDGRLRVGLVWAGGARPEDKRAWHANLRRSVKLASLTPLADIADIQWVSLQHGPEAGQLREVGWPISDPMTAVADFADTAAVVSQLDLVIAVDTAVAHLAGALGVQVWLLSRFDGCWRWLTDRSDSPWYPTMTIFRQHQPGEWAPVIDTVKSALAGRCQALRRAPAA